LLKATFSEEVSDRMADVNDARSTGEKLINALKGNLLEADKRDKDFVLRQCAKWLDEEKSVRIEADRSNKNELDIQYAATAAREESRNVLRMIQDRLGDEELISGQRELQVSERAERGAGGGGGGGRREHGPLLKYHCL